MRVFDAKVHNEVCCSEHIKVHLAYAGTLQERWWPEQKIWVHFNGDLICKLTDVVTYVVLHLEENTFVSFHMVDCISQY